MNTVKKVLATIALLFLTFSPTTLASAHTESDKTTPSSGSTVDAGVQTISISFTDKILNLADSSEISITGPAGDEVEISCIEVKDKAIRADALLSTEGEYKVVWRTVAEDGHPITGKFSFTVTGTANQEDFVSCKEQAGQGNEVISPKPTAQPSANSITPMWVYWVAGIAVILIGLVVMIFRKSAG